VFAAACFVVLVAFLGCLGLFALAVTKVVAPDGRGHARGFAGGCASVLALFLLCALGMTGLAATVAAIGLGSVAHWNPIRHIEISRVHGRESGDGEERRSARESHESHDDSAVSARFTVHGDGGGELVELLHELVDVDLDELGDGLTIHQRTSPTGGEFSVYEFRLPISEADLERFERDVRVELDGLRLRLPERVDIEFDGAD
jgi:hypothetical protein